MDCLLLLLVIFTVSLIPYSQGVASISEEPRIPWQQILEDVKKTSSLAQVQREYMMDIELVEAAASPCSKGHRQKLQQASNHLITVVQHCEEVSGRQREALNSCVENSTKREVNDVRLNINLLKSCVDSSG